MRFFLIATSISSIATNGLHRTQWKCSHYATATTSPTSMQPIVSKNKSQSQIVQCEMTLRDILRMLTNFTAGKQHLRNYLLTNSTPTPTTPTCLHVFDGIKKSMPTTEKYHTNEQKNYFAQQVNNSLLIDISQFKFFRSCFYGQFENRPTINKYWPTFVWRNCFTYAISNSS